MRSGRPSTNQIEFDDIRRWDVPDMHSKSKMNSYNMSVIGLCVLHESQKLTVDWYYCVGNHE